MPFVPRSRILGRAPLLALLVAGLHCPVHVEATDNDNDGIPAAWEDFRGTSDSDPSDALVDFDGDGLTTYMEYITQGRPWGNYVMHRFPWQALPASVPASGISWMDFSGANRSGEFLLTCYDAAGQHSFLWTPVPGEPLAEAEVTEIPATFPYHPPWNDNGQIFIPDPLVEGTGEIRNLRQWDSTPIPITWDSSFSNSPEALSNDGRLLLRWEEAYGSSGGSENFQWTNGTSPGEILTFAYGVFTSLNYNPAVDPASGLWILGNYDTSNVIETLAWHLGPDSAPISLLSVASMPGDLYGYGMYAAAAGKAVGVAQSPTNGPATLLFDGSTWQTISGGVAGSAPWPYGVSDTGIVFAWNWNDPPYQPFLWKGVVVEMSKARPEIAGGMYPSGLTGDGTVYAIDFGDWTSPQQPVVFRLVENAVGDGAAEENAGPQDDADGDGILDANEAGYGTDAALLDSDGDGWADLFEFQYERDPASPEPPMPPPGMTGLAVFTPGQHPLATSPGPP